MLQRWLAVVAAVGLGMLVACAGPRPGPAATATPPVSAMPTPLPSRAATATPIGSQAAAPELIAGAVQTVLDYYDAIAAGRYREAYDLWADGGAASGQSLAQFRQGFATTAGLRVVISDMPELTDAGVRVPVALVAVNNGATPNAPQTAQSYTGDWLVEPDASGAARLRAARIAPVPEMVLPPELGDPVALVTRYYELLNQRRYAQAYPFWADQGRATGRSFARFVAELADVETWTSVVGQARLGGAAGSLYADVPAAVAGARVDGTQQVQCGAYTLRRSNLPPFDQLGWSIERAQLQTLNGMAASADQLRQLLRDGCQP